MRRTLAIAIVAFIAGASIATAATAWRVVGRASASGAYAIATPQATVKKPAALAVRVAGGTHDVTWSMACSGRIAKAAAGRIYPLAVGNSDDCTISALGSRDGKASVQILARGR